MKSILRPFASFNAVAAGAVANLSIPTGGYVYNAIVLQYKETASTPAPKATFAADIESVKVKVNGDTLIDLTGAQLVDFNDFYGYSMPNGYMPIMFRRPEFLDVASEHRFALGTKGVLSVTVEVKIKSSATAPELAAYGDVMVGVERGLGQVVRIRSNAYGAQAAAGLREIQDLPIRGLASIGGYQSSERGLKALHVTSGNVDEHEIILNGLTVSEAPEALLNLWADLRAYQTVSRNPVTGYYHLDLAGNRYESIWGTSDASEFRLKLTFGAAAAAFSVITEEVIGNRDI